MFPETFSVFINQPLTTSFDKVVSALRQQNCKITTVDRQSGSLIFRTPISLTDWGYKFNITFQEVDGNRTKISGKGEPFYGLGGGKRKFEKLLKRVI